MALDDELDDSEEDEEKYVTIEPASENPVSKTKVYRPYGPKYLDALKKARMKQVRSEAVAMELITYVFFLIILFVTNILFIHTICLQSFVTFFTKNLFIGTLCQQSKFDF